MLDVLLLVTNLLDQNTGLVACLIACLILMIPVFFAYQLPIAVTSDNHDKVNISDWGSRQPPGLV